MFDASVTGVRSRIWRDAVDTYLLVHADHGNYVILPAIGASRDATGGQLLVAGGGNDAPPLSLHWNLSSQW
jgi:hypothetical protein